MQSTFARSLCRAAGHLIALCLLTGAALAQTTPNRLDEIVARGALRVGTTGDYKPFSFRADKSGKFIGLDIQLAGELARALGSLDAAGISAAAAKT